MAADDPGMSSVIFIHPLFSIDGRDRFDDATEDLDDLFRLSKGFVTGVQSRLGNGDMFTVWTEVLFTTGAEDFVTTCLTARLRRL